MIRVITDQSLEDRPLQCILETPSYALQRDDEGITRIYLKEYGIELYGNEHVSLLGEGKAGDKISDEEFLKACLQIAFIYMVNNNCLVDYLNWHRQQGQAEGADTVRAQLQAVILGRV